MKYPLRVADRPNMVPRVAVVDASGKVICGMMDEEWGHSFARLIVAVANSWRWAKWFRPYNHDDWMWERNETRAP